MAEITIKVKKADSLKERVVGLIGQKSAHGLLIETRFGIHTCGLDFPIDVIVLDKHEKVVKLKKKLQPFRLFFWNPSYDRVVELPDGWVEEKGIEIGSKINASHH